MAGFTFLGQNVTKNYVIGYEYGTLTVTKRPIALQTADASWGENVGWWTYDGMEHGADEDAFTVYGITEDGEEIDLDFSLDF